MMLTQQIHQLVNNCHVTQSKFHPNWSAFVEYNHADFGTNGGTFNSAVLGPVALNAKSNADLVLFGVNWRPSGGFGY